MEKFNRKKSVRSFGRELIAECLDSRDKDVIVRCSDGDMSFNRLFTYNQYQFSSWWLKVEEGMHEC